LTAGNGEKGKIANNASNFSLRWKRSSCSRLHRTLGNVQATRASRKTVRRKKALQVIAKQYWARRKMNGNGNGFRAIFRGPRFHATAALLGKIKRHRRNFSPRWSRFSVSSVRMWPPGVGFVENPTSPTGYFILLVGISLAIASAPIRPPLSRP